MWRQQSQYREKMQCPSYTDITSAWLCLPTSVPTLPPSCSLCTDASSQLIPTAQAGARVPSVVPMALHVSRSITDTQPFQNKGSLNLVSPACNMRKWKWRVLANLVMKRVIRAQPLAPLSLGSLCALTQPWGKLEGWSKRLHGGCREMYLYTLKL